MSRRLVWIACLAFIIAYAALLRLDAITLSYGPVERPGWLKAFQESRGPESVLRPSGMTWTAAPVYPHADGTSTHYISDPYTYLQYAREMDSFFEAHRREPLFPAVTKAFLALFADQDVAVSFASATFSVLSVILTAILGASVFSRPVGLVAAGALAIEYDAISWGIAGWRDDAFTCGVLASAWLMVRYLRKPSGLNAVALGVVAGGACLVRITALSFLLPGAAFLVLVLRGWRRPRWIEIAYGTAAAAALIGPFLVNCWLVFGDPFHAINVHADVYRAAGGQVETGGSAAEYLVRQGERRPIETLDTALTGLTIYPFSNKWHGFDVWGRWLGKGLSWAAMAGLFLFVGSREGRLLLVVLVSSLIPYALTWKLIFDWRFTQHAYPFYLVAAALALSRFATILRPWRIEWRRPTWQEATLWVSAAAAVVLAVFLYTRILPNMLFAETIAAEDTAMITAGTRDGAFFSGGWSPAELGVNVSTRVARGDRHLLQLPLPTVQGYDVIARLNPHPPPAGETGTNLPTVRVLFNGTEVASLPLTWNPQRMGSYSFHLPERAVRPNRNELVFVRANGPTSFSLWYVRVHPVGPDAQ
jgi:4-amino-4-deoxy-L-arabinose transferase-like glycosyltransferase